MKRERNLGVTEAGIGLAFLIGFLVMVGYLTLQFLGGTSRSPTVEVRPDARAETPRHVFAARPQIDEQPQVLTVEAQPANHVARPVGAEPELH